ncbi:MAG: tetratricopeptide repeat protein [candidate division Zixibacteria bacterium]|nr:tetratricopeptide repeat protein [candidate division Zixibacteria bacterium]
MSCRDELTNRLLQAQRLVDEEQYEKALAMATPLVERITASDRERYLFSRRLLAFAFSQLGRFEEASRYAGEGDALCPDCLDFPFILTITAARQKQYDDAVRHGRRYLDLWAKRREISSSCGEWDRTFDRAHQLLNAYGVALLEASRPKEAEAAFREAIELCPGFDSSYINLSLFFSRQGKTAEAREVIQAGLKAAPESAELRRMADPTRDRATVSVCMIVKNEEALLPRCLQSVRELADEIIVVDTGSTDRTMEIARDFGGIVFEYPWQGDFSSARNESIRHATKDWILIIDADEELPAEETAALRFFINQPDIQVISLSVYNKSLETGRISSFLPSMRLFRRSLDLRYYGIVHNRLDVPPDIPVTRCQARIYHYGYDLSPEALEKKKARTMALLEQQLADNPDDVYANFNMAQLLRGFRDADSEAVSRKIIEHAGRVIRNPESRTKRYHGQRLMSLHQMATALHATKQYEEAEKYCQEALAAKPGYLDPMMTLGHIHLASGRLDQAKAYYHRYLEAREKYRAGDETDNIILLYLDGLHIAWYGLGLIAEKEKSVFEAIQCHRRVLQAQEPYLDTYLRLGRLCLDARDPVASEEMFRKEAEQNDRSVWAWFGLGEALAMQGREELSLDYFRKAAELAPDHPHIILRLGKTRLKLGDSAGAIRDLQKAGEAGVSDMDLLFQTANCLFEAGAFDEAAGLYHQVLEKSPDKTEAILNFGNCLFKKGDLPGACAEYEQVIQTRPDFLVAWRNMGLAKGRLNDPEGGLAALLPYIKMNPQDAQISLLIGDLYVSQGNEAEAVKWYERYLQLRPRDDVGVVRLAESYMRQGFTEAAALGFRNALMLNPECHPARKRLAEIETSISPVSL